MIGRNKNNLKYRLAAAAFALMLLAGGMAAAFEGVWGFTINTGTYLAMSKYPDIRKCDYSKIKPERELVSEENMVDPSYFINNVDSTIDEFYGNVSTVNFGQSQLDGFMLKDNIKGECGVRYNRLFRYENMWIDVRSTFVDWEVYDKSKAFARGGFCSVSWKNVKYLRMHHEFFESGTDNPVEIKGFFTYYDVDDNQGLGLLPDEVQNVWMNTGGSYLKYKITNEGYLFIKDNDGRTVPGPTSADYSPAQAAKVMFSYTFKGTTHDQFILDGVDDNSTNAIKFDSRKFIPSSIPDTGEGVIEKQVRAGDEDYSRSCSVRSWKGSWQYMVTGLVTMETEQGNFYDEFIMRDEVDSCLEIEKVRIIRGTGEDVSSWFDISVDDRNVLTARSLVTDNEDFYGWWYYMVIDVKLRADETEMTEHGHFTDEYTASIENTARVSYTDGKGTYDRDTENTVAEVRYPYRSDIVITKRIRKDEIYLEHGIPTFVIRLSGRTAAEDEEVEYNKSVTFSREYIENQEQTKSEYIDASLTFKDVAEGKYTCSEYENLRYRLRSISDIRGGAAADDKVVFKVDSPDERGAVFENSRKNWNDYSDSRCIVNCIGDFR